MKIGTKKSVVFGAAVAFAIASVTVSALENSQNSTTGKQNSQAVQPDNTKVNERDRNGDTLTAGDQSNTEADRKITQSIRQAIVKDANLSTVAKNIKIITVDGSVTLRGPVNTEAEKAQIAEVATKAANSAKISNQLEVKGQAQSQNETSTPNQTSNR